MSGGGASDRRRGSVIFEVVLSIGLFAGAAIFCLSVTREALTALERGQLQQEAVDLARSKLVELEAGLIGIGDLRGGDIDSVGSGRDLTADGELPPWQYDVETQRTQYRGLTLVALTVTSPTTNEVQSDAAVSVTLRQLVRLSEVDVEAYETDPLIDDLPEPDPLEPTP